MLRRFIRSMISLLFIAYVGGTAGLSLVGPAFAQVGSGGGTFAVASVGACLSKISMDGISSLVDIDAQTPAGTAYSGGSYEQNGTINSGLPQFLPTSFPTCSVTNVVIISQSGPSGGVFSSTLNFTWTYNGVNYSFNGIASPTGVFYSTTVVSSELYRVSKTPS
jgi:hypothetical protein